MSNNSWAWFNVIGNSACLVAWGFLPTLRDNVFRMPMMLVSAFFMGIGFLSIVTRKHSTDQSSEASHNNDLGKP